MTQLALAAHTGLRNDTISRLELGQRAPRAATIQLLVQALGVPAEAFIEDRPVSDPFSPSRAAAMRSPSGTPVQEDPEEALRQGIASLRQER